MKLEHILIIILFGVIVYFWQCRKTVIKNDIKEVHFTDTIFKTDTLVDYIYKEHKDIQPSEIIKDTVKGIDLSDTSIFWRYYVYNIKDSLLDAKITAHAQTRPTIDFKYSLKNYTIHDTITIKDSVYTECKIKNALFYGAEISGNQNRFGFSPSLTFSHRSGMNYSVRYDLINKEIGVKFERKF